MGKKAGYVCSNVPRVSGDPCLILQQFIAINAGAEHWYIYLNKMNILVLAG